MIKIGNIIHQRHQQKVEHSREITQSCDDLDSMEAGNIPIHEEPLFTPEEQSWYYAMDPRDKASYENYKMRQRELRAARERDKLSRELARIALTQNLGRGEYIMGWTWALFTAFILIGFCIMLWYGILSLGESEIYV